MTPERIVAFLSPLLVSLSGAIVQLIARYAPGAPQLDADMLAGFFALGVAAGVGVILKWFSERGKQNARASE